MTETAPRPARSTCRPRRASVAPNAERSGFLDDGVDEFDGQVTGQITQVTKVRRHPCHRRQPGWVRERDTDRATGPPTSRMILEIPGSTRGSVAPPHRGVDLLLDSSTHCLGYMALGPFISTRPSTVSVIHKCGRHWSTSIMRLIGKCRPAGLFEPTGAIGRQRSGPSPATTEWHSSLGHTAGRGNFQEVLRPLVRKFRECLWRGVRHR